MEDSIWGIRQRKYLLINIRLIANIGLTYNIFEMEKFIELFAEALEREDEIKMEDEFRNYNEWSSLAYLSVIAMIDEEYDIQIEQADFKKIRTVKELYDVCSKK